VELSGAVEAYKEACELQWAVRKLMGWLVWIEVARRRAPEGTELAAAVEAGQAAMALGAYALEQSERERCEGEQMGEGERVPARSPYLSEPEATSGGANGAWRPCVRRVLF
jgi:hypothetical protein